MASGLGMAVSVAFPTTKATCIRHDQKTGINRMSLVYMHTKFQQSWPSDSMFATRPKAKGEILGHIEHNVINQLTWRTLLDGTTNDDNG